ncbi:MAG: 4-(cytidine 5'-diphospho)-2-C-methyl-D-erythritol kinase [Oscillospiraceae bacterium]|nr:4-(cytidine 5'-diphospho)-2-C-methyl-D-erythritol kinase [Oscillospiraceae bacterium]
MIVKALAYAKINLGLQICDKRPDGFHNLRMVTQSISIADRIIVKKAKHFDINVIGTKTITKKKNIVLKGAENFFAKTGTRFGVEIFIKKNIPIGAGLGGGSADAAAVILAMKKISKIKLSDESLFEIALNTGSDVPLCIVGGTLSVEGTGEKIEPLKPLKNCKIIIAVPDLRCETKKIYAMYDLYKKSNPSIATNGNERMENLKKCIKLEKIEDILVNTFNDFEKVIKCNAKGFRITGSGSASYFFADKKSYLEEIIEHTKSQGFKTFVCEPVRFGVKLS